MTIEKKPVRASDDTLMIVRAIAIHAAVMTYKQSAPPPEDIKRMAEHYVDYIMDV